jgi:hypothetical protein
LKALCFMFVLLLIMALGAFAKSCTGSPRLIFNVPPIKYVLCYDTDSDGHINAQDVILVSRTFGTVSGGLNWVPAADINGDGKVDIIDVALIVFLSSADV